jgi:hypothetical protein
MTTSLWIRDGELETFHQKATNQVGRDPLGRAGEKTWGSAGKTSMALGAAWVGIGGKYWERAWGYADYASGRPLAANEDAGEA